MSAKRGAAAKKTISARGCSVSPEWALRVLEEVWRIGYDLTIGDERWWEDVRAAVDGRVALDEGRMHAVSRIICAAVPNPSGRSSRDTHTGAWGPAGEKPAQHPPAALLAAAIRTRRPIPADMCDYVAGRLDGSITLPRGKPTFDLSKGIFRWLRRVVLADRVWRWQRVFSHPRYAREYRRKHGRLPPQESACEKAKACVSRERNIPTETLDKYAYPRSE